MLLDQATKALVIGTVKMQDTHRAAADSRHRLSGEHRRRVQHPARRPSGWQRWFFIGLALVVSVVLMVWLRRIRAEQTILAIGLSLVLGGALGNVIDRVMHGYVVDFIYFHWRSWYFPAFNVADTAISIGAGCLLIDAFRESGHGKKPTGERRAGAE